MRSIACLRRSAGRRGGGAAAAATCRARARHSRHAGGRALAIATALAAAALGAAADDGGADEPVRRNGFLLAPASIPAEEILSGGPPRDAIPALVSPPAVTATLASWSDMDRVIGVVVGDEARAYPLIVLTWHELVNDSVGGQPILVSYCPLCGTGMVFDRSLGKETLVFGVSGLLYRSDVLMYDTATESLWSQIAAAAVTGPRLGSRLRVLRSEHTTWGAWRARHPGTTVLTGNTGYQRPYGADPYRDYARSARLAFPAPLDRRFHPKMRTLGLRSGDGRSRAYPSHEVERAGGCVVDRFGGHPVRVRWNPQTRSFEVQAPQELEVIDGYWFAWAAFHPQTQVFRAADASADARCTRD